MHYYLIPFSLKAEEKKYKSVHYSAGVLNLQQLIDQYMMKYGTSATKTDAEMLVTLFFKAVEDALADGYTVQTDLFRARVKVEGIFENQYEKFNKDKHSIRPQFITSKSLLKRFSKFKGVLKSNPRFKPQISSIRDLLSDTINSQISPGGLAELKGIKLHFDAKDNEQGYFLLDENGAALRIDHFASNLPSSCTLMVPKELKKGRYQLEFRGTPGEGRAWVRVVLDYWLEVL